MFLIEETDFVPPEDPGSDIIADLIIDHIACDCCEHENGRDSQQVDITTGGQRAQKEQQGVTGQERGNYQARLAEYHQK